VAKKKPRHKIDLGWFDERTEAWAKWNQEYSLRDQTWFTEWAKLLEQEAKESRELEATLAMLSKARRKVVSFLKDRPNRSSHISEVVRHLHPNLPESKIPFRYERTRVLVYEINRALDQGNAPFRLIIQSPIISLVHVGSNSHPV
jgi:hypothetical protein